MITVIVKYSPEKCYSRDEILAMLKFGAENMFKGLPHLYSKQFCFDVDKNQALASKYQVRGVPTLVLFKQGQQLWRQSGIVQKEDLIRIIKSH